MPMNEPPKTADVRQQLIRAGLTPPNRVTLVITDHCNLNCQHCWPDSGPTEERLPVPIIKLKKAVEEIIDLGAQKLVITGGEPLSHPQWDELLDFACGQPSLGEVWLQTNTMLLTPMDVNKLATLSEQGLFIQVSLEGANAATHDPIRGAGSFARTVNGLTRLIKAGLSQQMCIAFTEMQHNFGEIPELLDMVVQMGIGRFVSGTLVESGRAANTPHIAPPTPAQYKWLLDVYHSDKTFREQYQQIGNISALEWQLDTTPMENPGCCRLIESPYITASGTFYPCVMLHAQAYAARDIFRHPLAEAIHDILPLWQELQQLGQCRVLEAEPCKDCSHAALCGAGCMGRAFALHGNLTAPEDRCQLRQAVYNWKPSSQMLRK